MYRILAQTVGKRRDRSGGTGDWRKRRPVRAIAVPTRRVHKDVGVPSGARRQAIREANRKERGPDGDLAIELYAQLSEELAVSNPDSSFPER